MTGGGLRTGDVMTDGAQDDARTAVLGALRDALGDVPAAERVDDPVERHYVRDRTFADPVARLRQRLEDTHTEVTVCAPGDVPAAVAVALSEGTNGGGGDGGGDGPVVCAPGLPEQWRCADPVLRPDDGQFDAAAMAAFRAGVTGATVAIAETGTVVLDGNDVSGRRLLSLVPDRHVCIVAESDIVADVPQALPRLDPRRPLTFITGPSATVDIELVRSQGVHGPRFLHVIIVTENQPAENQPAENQPAEKHPSANQPSEPRHAKP